MKTLEDKMKDVLVNNRVEFVDLLLEEGVSMRKFLTKDRLNKLFKALTVSKTHDEYIIQIFVHHTRLNCIAVGLSLLINSKSLLFRHEVREHSAQMAYHFPVFTLLLASAYVSRTGMGW